ncbi:RNP containing family member [Mycena olivaceomarginata]|nr:RNP containing family member [Mycena olivaceomarginata]
MSDDEMNIDDVAAGGAVRRRGRGFQNTGGNDGTVTTEPTYDRVETSHVKDADTRAARCKYFLGENGWIVLVTNVHEEATEEDVTDKFAEFGEIKNLHLNLDRRTGYVKGYALVEYETMNDAQRAIDGASGTTLLEQAIQCDYAFVRPPPTGPKKGRGPRGRKRQSQPAQKARGHFD